MQRPWTAYGNLTAAMVIVGSSVVAGKLMVAELPVFLASALRFVVALAVLLPLMWWREGRLLPRLRGRNWRILGLQSLFGSFLFTTFLLYGLRWASPAAAGVVAGSTSAWMAGLAWLFLGERPGRRGMVGILCAMAGVACLNVMTPDAAAASDAGQAGAADAWLGLALVLAAVLCESLFLLMRKGVDQPLSPLGAATAVSAFGLLWFLPMGVVEAVRFDFAVAGPGAWGAVVYYGLVVTILAYWCWFAGVVRVDAATAGVFTGLMPASAVLCAVLILHEPLTWPVAAGCLLVLAGIVLLTARSRG
ncbi:DMT family transporter [Megalodesulfovibrio gigas]|uniref:EamA domain-containing protein n=1 Tax=Megalodesulfovibrio gigas (strain ATCC 19364 / DSM 1382 / NCIMB 9332 / VKM B-1759) TaxID=1121448 RepID=T2G8A6_MEGG1|nr:DMT family transporter [Megalodesulfovibrio gigas]AGW12518.1 putative protein of unknown function DUF6 transmembrane [Megalodesulfovibrio gigas DSM 1382 = ATCC 19364]